MGASSAGLGFAADEGLLGGADGDGRVDDGDGGGQTRPAGSFRRCLGDPICRPSKCGLVGVFGSSITFANGLVRAPAAPDPRKRTASSAREDLGLADDVLHGHALARPSAAIDVGRRPAGLEHGATL